MHVSAVPGPRTLRRALVIGGHPGFVARFGKTRYSRSELKLSRVKYTYKLSYRGGSIRRLSYVNQWILYSR